MSNILRVLAIAPLVLAIIPLSLGQGGGGGNYGPIFDKHPETLFQTRLPAQFPMIESWALGEWHLNYIYQEYPKYNITCGKLHVAQIIEGANGIIMFGTHKMPNGTSEERIITGERYTRILPGKYLIDSVTDGLIANSRHPGWFTTMGAEVLTLLSFTTNRPGESTYTAGIYIVNYQHYVGESYSWGLPKVSEVGILSRNGTIEPFIAEHLFSVWDELKKDKGQFPLLPDLAELVNVPC